jgi:K+-sensing histidine kinase KdpD
LVHLALGPPQLRDVFRHWYWTFTVIVTARVSTSLGLAVAHGIMESHDGPVTVHNQPGEGTVFHLAMMTSYRASLTSAVLSAQPPR